MNNNQYSARPYPIGAFPTRIRSAVLEVLKNMQSPDALVSMEFLSAMSACAQGLYDYESPTGSLRPVSLNSVLIAESGERKTSVHTIVAKPLYEFDELNMERYLEESKTYESQLQVWTTISKGYHRQLKKRAESQESNEDLLKLILEHDHGKPEKPRLRRFIRQNITSRAFMDALDGDGEAITVMTDEGGVVTKGGIFTFQALLNKGWDGAALLAMDRSDGVSIVARNPRVAVSLLVQPSAFKELNDQRGENLRGSGHWARYLVGWPESTQGRRYTETLTLRWLHLPEFHRKMGDVLKEYAERRDAGITERKVLTFSEEAKHRILELVNKTEEFIGPWGYFKDIKDAASKAVEVMGRLAALLHVFAGENGQISLETLESAIALYDWHLNEFKRIFATEEVASPAVLDAQTLENYLLRTVWNNGYTFVKKNYVRNNGPLRSALRMNEALDVLVQRGAVWIGTGYKNVSFINLVPTYFPGRMPGMLQPNLLGS
jgi:hypothetical protein